VGKITKISREVLLYGLVFFLISWGINLWRSPPLSREHLPPLSGYLIDGNSTDFFLSGNRPKLLHFWGSWCPICRAEASNIQWIGKHYPVLTVAVQSGDDRTIRSWMKKHNLSYPVQNDPEGRLAKQLHLSVYPTTLIYDGRGRLRFIATGYTTRLGLWARMKWVELRYNTQGASEQ